MSGSCPECGSGDVYEDKREWTLPDGTKVILIEYTCRVCGCSWRDTKEVRGG